MAAQDQGQTQQGQGRAVDPTEPHHELGRAWAEGGLALVVVVVVLVFGGEASWMAVGGGSGGWSSSVLPLLKSVGVGG